MWQARFSQHSSRIPAFQRPADTRGRNYRPPRSGVNSLSPRGDVMKIRAAFVTLAAGIGWFAVIGIAGQQAPPPDFAARPASAVRYLKASNPGEDDRLGIGNALVGVTMGMSAD